MKSRDDTNYLEALSEVVSQAKWMMGMTTVPLGIVLAQLRYLADLNLFWLKVLTTIAIVSLACATFLNWYSTLMIRGLYSLELFDRDGKTSEKGNAYLEWIGKAKMIEHFSMPVVMSHTIKLAGYVLVLALIGYLALACLILSIVWVKP